MFVHDPFSTRKRFISVFGLLITQALACSGGNASTTTDSGKGSVADGSDDSIDIVPSPDGDSGLNEESASPASNVNGTAGLPSIDASATDAGGADAQVRDAWQADAEPQDAGVRDASGPGVLVCPSMGLACDGGCVANDPRNCGACGKQCAVPANGAAICSSGAPGAAFTCGISCSANHTKCGGSCVDTQGDSNNCGTCAHSCLAGKCGAGNCQPWVVAADDGALRETLQAGLVADDRYVVWISSVGIKESPVEGGNPIPLVSQTTQEIYNLAMASGVVAWTMADANGGVDIETAVEGMSNSASGAYPVPNSSGCTPRGLSLTPDGTTAYFILDCMSAAQIYECDVTSFRCMPVVAASPANSSLGNYGNDVIFDNGLIFWTDSAGSAVNRYSMTSQQTELIGIPALPFRLALHSGYVYWATASADGRFAVARFLETGQLGSDTVAVDPLQGSLSAMATDGTEVYLAASRTIGDGGIADELDFEPATGGGQPVALPTPDPPTDSPFGVATAAGSVYWLSLNKPTGHVTLYGLRFP
jgi:hypothetical protein